MLPVAHVDPYLDLLPRQRGLVEQAAYGGWATFEAQGWPGRTIADALQGAGYRTGLFGKFLNAWDGTIPPGWTRSRRTSASRVSRSRRSAPYYDYTLRVLNGGTVTDVTYGEAPEDYATAVAGALASDYIRSTPATEPMFLFFAPPAPHSAAHGPPIPAPRT